MSSTDQNAIQSRELLEDSSIVLIHLEGKLNPNHSDELANCIDQEFSSGNFKIVLGLGGLKTILSSHLGVLWQRTQIARQNGGDICFFDIPPAIDSVFSKIKFQTITGCYGSLDRCIQHFESL